jgi:hypothetical protein
LKKCNKVRKIPATVRYRSGDDGDVCNINLYIRGDRDGEVGGVATISENLPMATARSWGDDEVFRKNRQGTLPATSTEASRGLWGYF